MSTPAITIGMPVYNGADYLEEAIQSVLAQTFTDFELLISEGGSTDGTRAIIEKYVALDPRVRYERTETRLTQVLNCNRVVELARAEWVQFLCHDDILFPWALRFITHACMRAPGQVALIGHYSPNLFHSKYVLLNGQVLAANEVGVPSSDQAIDICGPDAARRIMRLGRSPQLPGLTPAAVRRSALLGIGGFDARFAQFDTRAWNRLLLRHDYIWMSAPLSLTRIHNAQVTTLLCGRPRTVEDNVTFWPEWIREARGLGIEIPFRARMLPWLKTSMEAASQVWIACIRFGLPAAFKMLTAFGPKYIAGVLLLMPRAIVHDKMRKRGVPEAYNYLKNG